MAHVRFLFPALCALALGACDPGTGTGPDPDPTPAPVPVAAVRVEAPAPRLWAGKSMQLSVRVLAASGDSLPGRVVRWSSSDSTVATVSDSGRVTGRTLGAVDITATSEGKSATLWLSVVEPVAHCSMGTSVRMLAPGVTLKLWAGPHDRDGRPLAGRPVTWRSSDPAVLSVDSTGLVTAVAVGSASVIASCDGLESGVTLRVDPGYTLTPLQTPAGSFSFADDLNDRGEVVGEVQGPPEAPRAVLWRNGQLIELGLPGSRSLTGGISENGLVVGSFTSAATDVGYRPFLWRDGTVTQLDPAAAEESVFATDVNSAGVVVGYSATMASGRIVGSALSWSDGRRRDWGRMDGNNARFVRVNDAGQMLGVACATTCSSFLLAGAQRTSLPDEATGLSPNGWVTAAGAWSADRLQGSGGYVWKDGKATYHFPTRFAYLRLLDVNDSGRAVGTHMHGNDRDLNYGFVVHEGVVTRLDNLLAHARGWRVLAATGINNHGQIIAIGQHTSSHVTVAVLLTPRR